MPATEIFHWKQKQLHVVFAASSVVLLVAVLAMMYQDQNDEWREYQKTNFDLEAAIQERDLQAAETSSFIEEKETLEIELRNARQQLDGLRKSQATEFARNDQLTRDVKQLEVRVKFDNSIRDEERSKYDLGVRDAFPEDQLQVLYDAYLVRQNICSERVTELEALQASLAQSNETLKQFTSQTEDLTKALDKYTSDVARIKTSLEVIKPSGAASRFKRSLMELPIIDGFNSHLKVVQDWLPDLKVTLGMAKIARFDRCRTCHLNIDKTGKGGIPAFPVDHSDTGELADWVAANAFPVPFATHSREDLYCTASSPHPVNKFGCTSCHDGQGSGTSFGNAEHTPNDPGIQEEWHEEYGYHPNHFWEYPMQPQRFAESTCIKCHHSVTELGINPEFGASAPKVFRGYELIKQYGCFGCHEIHGTDAGVAIGPDLRLEPRDEADAAAIAADPTKVAGTMRKVGPSLRYVAAKTSEAFIRYWTEIPGRYRPTTRMPQFFDLHSHLTDAPGDEAGDAKALEAVELAGIARLLTQNSQKIDLLEPADGYVPNIDRGRKLFTQRGCLACHQHAAVPGTTADFGPNISDIHQKVTRNADDPTFSNWLYSWLRDPTRYHERTRMPNLFLTTYPDKDGTSTIDPAADITAFLLAQGQPTQFPESNVTGEAVDNLVTMYLVKSGLGKDAVRQIIETGHYPRKKGDIATDEVMLATEDGAAVSDPANWSEMKLQYVGRKAISRYGCYGCHDIPGYEEARPIGTPLQDWGRKDTSKLAFEHIEEFLHHHGEPADSEFHSTTERIEDGLRRMIAGGVEAGEFTEEQEKSEMAAAYFYESLQHHGRAGFLWQKLREPRSYDYMKTQTKDYFDRLRMPKFPLKENDIEAIETFILGLVAEPPASEYVYAPDERDRYRIEGEFLLAKYNCTGCHMLELPRITFGADVEQIYATEITAADHAEGIDLLLQFRKPHAALTGETRMFGIGEDATELPIASFHGLRYAYPDPEEEPEYQEHGFDTWQTLDFDFVDQPKRLLPGSRLTVLDPLLVSETPARGGSFAEWLVEDLMKTTTGGNRYLAWQSSPPPLYQEGRKVQTPWLYRFLLEPEQLRYTTVLRMPKFNMSPKEARVLANYFAAVDGSVFPYQEDRPTNPDYLASTETDLAHRGLLTDGESYLEESWRALNGPLCIKCHSLGGRKFKVSDPVKDIQGPNLNVVQRRLRADWIKLWLYKPTWIAPYTSMPVNYPKNNTAQFPDLFEGQPGVQITATRDALLNYTKLMEDIGPTTYAPPGAANPPAANPPADAGAAAAGGE
jgi:cytochrome c2